MERWESGDGKYVMIEADGKTVYAYFSSDAKGTTGLVWLFNLVPGPDEIPWDGVKEGPFVCPARFAHEFNHLDTLSVDDFEVQLKGDDVLLSAGIYFRGHLIGIVYDGKLPGKSRFANVDTPIALKMDVPIDPKAN